MRTIFEGIRNMPIKNYARLVLQLNSLLKEIGFERVNYQQRLNINTFYNKLTLMIAPAMDFAEENQIDPEHRANYPISVNVVNSYAGTDWKRIGEYLIGRKGYYGLNNYRYVVKSKEEVIPINAKTKAEDLVRIGDYFKERNIVTLYVNIFNSDMTDSNSEMIFPIIGDIKKAVAEIKISKVDVSEKMKYAMLNSFKKEIESKLNEVEDNIHSREQSLQDRKRELVDLIKHLDVGKAEIESLKTFSLNIDTTLKSQIDELKKLTFVKNVRLTTKGIKMNLGRIYLNYRGVDMYMGEYNLTIHPDRVEIECVNPVISGDGQLLHHPHINDGGNCYGGERALKIEEYLACFDLKKLVYFIYLFLKSYNDSDCYNKIRFWEKRPKRVKKTKEDTVNDFQDDFVGDDTNEVRDNLDGDDNDNDDENNDNDEDTCPDCGHPYDECTCENPDR